MIYHKPWNTEFSNASLFALTMTLLLIGSERTGSLDDSESDTSSGYPSRPPTPFSRPLTAPTIHRPTVSFNNYNEWLSNVNDLQ